MLLVFATILLKIDWDLSLPFLSCTSPVGFIYNIYRIHGLYHVFSSKPSKITYAFYMVFNLFCYILWILTVFYKNKLISTSHYSGCSKEIFWSVTLMYKIIYMYIFMSTFFTCSSLSINNFFYQIDNIMLEVLHIFQQKKKRVN